MKTTHATSLFCAILLLCCVACKPGSTPSSNTPSPTGAYPVAEWDRATEILMHTPGEELFNGIINPLAGLFEYYFDVDTAAKEHRGYIEMIEAHGIKVHTVMDILHHAPIEDLREYVREELKYDASQDDTESIASNERYRLHTIAQMSRNDLIRCILLRPYVRLDDTDNNTGVEARYEQSPLFNLYFTRDQSITTPEGVIIGKMNSSQRAEETKLIAFCYDQLGIEPTLHITGEGRLEGGDYIPAGDHAFIGCGMRTNIEGISQIMTADAFGHDTIVVVKDNKRWQMQMHLDTYFNIIDKDLCTLVESRYKANPGDPEWLTADIYVRTPDRDSYSLSKAEVPFTEYLRDKGYDIIPISEADELHYANNYLTIAPRHILAVAHQSEALAKAFEKHQVKVEWVELENLIKGYGAAHCMTQVLKRQPVAEE